MKLTVAFRDSDYDAYSATPQTLSLSSKQRAILYSAFSLCLIRDAWEPISDSDWEQLELELSDIVGELDS